MTNDEIIHLLIQNCEDAFGVDLGDDRDTLEDALYRYLDDHPESPGDLLGATGLLKVALKVISELPRISHETAKAIQHFAQEAQSGDNQFSHYASGDDLPQELVEWLYECQSLWPLMPHNLVRDHMDLIKKGALRYKIPARIDPELEFEDLLSVAREALHTAALKMFESPRDNFRNFAMQIIKDQIKNHQSQRYPLPFNKRKKLASLRQARDELNVQGFDQEALGQLADRLEFHPDEVSDLIEIESVWGDGQMVDYGDRMEELQIPDKQPNALAQMIEIEEDAQMSRGMTRLTAMQRNVILKIYYQDHSFRETAKELGVSLSVVKKHHRNAMALLKSQLEDDANAAGN